MKPSDHPIVAKLGPAVRSCLLSGSGEEARVHAGAADWERELDAIIAGQLSAIALRSIRAAGVGSPAVLDVLKHHAMALAVRSMRVEAATAGALRCLHDDDLPFAVVKGPAVARFYDEPGVRPFSDFDLLVSPRSFGRARRLLVDAGYVREPSARQPWDWFERICLEGVNLHSPGGGNVDLHHHVAPWSFGTRVDADAVLASSDPGVLSGVPVRFAAMSDALVIAALHIVNDVGKADPSLISWRDTYFLASRLGAERAAAAFERAGLGWFEPYVRAIHAMIAGVEPSIPSRTARAPLRELRLRWLGWGGTSFAARHPIGWAVRLPVGRATAFVVGSALPSPGYARDKHAGYVGYWRDSFHSLEAAARGTDFRTEALHGR